MAALFCLVLALLLILSAVAIRAYVRGRAEPYVGIPVGTYPGDLRVFQAYPGTGYTPGYVPLGTWRGWQRAPCEAGKVSVEAIIEARRAAEQALSEMGAYEYYPPRDAYNVNRFGAPRGLTYDMGANT